MAIQLQFGDTLKFASDGTIRILSAEGSVKNANKELTAVGVSIAVRNYLRDNRGIDSIVLERVKVILLAALRPCVGTDSSVTHSDFIRLVDDAIGSVSNRQLADFASHLYAPDSVEVMERQGAEPLHVRQLHSIDLKNLANDILPAISSLMRADENLHIWLRNGIVTEAGYAELTGELTNRYREIRRRVEDDRGGNLPENHALRTPPENRGREVYSRCREIKDLNMNGHEPPNGFIKGVLECLANDEKNCCVFWHPNGEKTFFPGRRPEEEVF